MPFSASAPRQFGPAEPIADLISQILSLVEGPAPLPNAPRYYPKRKTIWYFTHGYLNPLPLCSCPPHCGLAAVGWVPHRPTLRESTQIEKQYGISRIARYHPTPPRKHPNPKKVWDLTHHHPNPTADPHGQAPRGSTQNNK